MSRNRVYKSTYSRADVYGESTNSNPSPYNQPQHRSLSNRDFKQPKFDFPATYKEYRKMRSTSGPMNASQAYDNIMTNRKREGFAPVNAATYTNSPQTRFNPKYQNLLARRNFYNKFNPATGMPHGEWQNTYTNDITAQNSYPGCSSTAEPLDTNSYDQLYHQETTPLSRDFFADRNIEFIRNSISQIFRHKYSIPLGLQPYKPTKLFMMLVYNDIACDMCQDTGRGSRNFNILNTYTLEELEKRIYKNLDQQFGYQNWVQKATYSVQIQNPQYSRPAGKELSLSRYYNGCDYQK